MATGLSATEIVRELSMTSHTDSNSKPMICLPEHRKATALKLGRRGAAT